MKTTPIWDSEDALLVDQNMADLLQLLKTGVFCLWCKVIVRSLNETAWMFSCAEALGSCLLPCILCLLTDTFSSLFTDTLALFYELPVSLWSWMVYDRCVCVCIIYICKVDAFNECCSETIQLHDLGFIFHFNYFLQSLMWLCHKG